MNPRDIVHKAFVEHFKLDAATLSEDTKLADAGIDSLSLAEFLFALEDDYGLPSFEAPTLPVTFGELLALVDQIPADVMAQAAQKAA